MEQGAQLQIESLVKHFQAKDGAGRRVTVRAVDGVSFSIARGETLGLVGESGCGKTTLGRAILRLCEPDGGRILFGGQDITQVDMRPYRRRMQIVFQDPAGSLDPRMRVRDIIAEGLLANGIGASKAERLEMVVDLLNQVGLNAENAQRYPHEFSGGQQQRVGIARALSVNPEFVVCDEPVSALDVSCQSQIINLLVDLQKNMGLTYLFISHDLSVVRHISDRIGVMYLGKLVEIGDAEEVIAAAAHPYTQSLLSAIPIPDPKLSRAREHRPLSGEAQELATPQTGCCFSPRCGRAGALCREVTPDLKEIGAGHFCACHLC